MDDGTFYPPAFSLSSAISHSIHTASLLLLCTLCAFALLCLGILSRRADSAAQCSARVPRAIWLRLRRAVSLRFNSRCMSAACRLFDKLAREPDVAHLRPVL